MAEDRSAAVRTPLLRGLVPRHERTGRVFLTAQIAIAAFGLLFDDAGAAQRALDAGVLDNRLGELALRIVRAREELAEAAELDDHLTAAVFADFLGLLRTDLDTLSLHVGLGLLQCGGEIVIEPVENLHIADLALLDLVQLLLHLGGEAQVGNRGKLVYQQFGDALAQRRRLE